MFMVSLFKTKIPDFGKMGTAWIRHVHTVFFLLLLIVFGFAVWEWYGMVYAPEDRTEEIKEKILRSSNREMLDEKRFETLLQTLQNRKTPSFEAGSGHALFQ